MELEHLLNAMTPEVYQRIATAVETGKWPDGTPLSQGQRDSAMQAVMLYQSRHNTDAEHMSVAVGGELKFKSKAELKRDFGVDEPSHNDIARFDRNQI
ncbi:DUF1315 family protein [uncultured Photobacterium sp.]|uniref:YeaC family protein n=1 Tax=uncultured Photobacterium sp. TaxID=173973 RepID=UPI002631396F|nr:DUF1315 family protein [uncultured Photobacterium sp.]